MKRILPYLEFLLITGGILVFAWFAHGKGISFLVAMAGLLVSSAGIAVSLFRSADPLSVLGLQRFNLNTLRLSLQFSAVGIAMTVLYRYKSGMSLFPHALTTVALITPFIGMTEELVFRGFIQGRLRSTGFFISILLASAGHASYKFLVLKSLPFDLGTDLPWLALSTFAVGLVLGAFREICGTVVPAMIAHAAFDIFLYGDSVKMPAWVWG
jgi:membrane protease YdiL (CAAX protease family)